jgi:hypothetical protein
MLSRSNGSEPAYLGKITIVAGEINHLLRRLWSGPDPTGGGEIIVVVVVVVIKEFSVLRAQPRKRVGVTGDSHSSVLVRPSRTD